MKRKEKKCMRIVFLASVREDYCMLEIGELILVFVDYVLRFRK